MAAAAVLLRLRFYKNECQHQVWVFTAQTQGNRLGTQQLLSQRASSIPPTSRKPSKTSVLTTQHRSCSKLPSSLYGSSGYFLPILISLWSWDYKAFQNAYADPSIPALASGRATPGQGRSPGIRGHPALASPRPGRIHSRACLLNSKCSLS